MKILFSRCLYEIPIFKWQEAFKQPQLVNAQ